MFILGVGYFYPIEFVANLPQFKPVLQKPPLFQAPILRGFEHGYTGCNLYAGQFEYVTIS
jgi:hypothetical protein